MRTRAPSLTFTVYVSIRGALSLSGSTGTPDYEFLHGFTSRGSIPFAELRNECVAER